MRTPHSFLFGLLTAVAISGAAFAEDTCTNDAPSSSGGTSDCQTIMSIRPNQLFKVDAKVIHHCMTQGWDPPCCWRPDGCTGGNIKVEGAGGFSKGIIQAPDRPPGCATLDSGGNCVGANADVSQDQMQWSLHFPKWQGWPYSTGGGSGGGGSGGGSSGGSGSCPTSDSDTKATFGEQDKFTRMKPVGSEPLACGGSVPLTTYDMALYPNADNLFVTEYDQPLYWIWHREGTHYVLLTSPNGNPLPTAVCNGSDLPRPIGQMISFNSSLSSLPVRLIQKYPPPPLTPPSTPEFYMLLPLSGGEYKGDGHCIDKSDYASPGDHVADLNYRMVTGGGCEAPPAVCQQQHLDQTPTALANCSLNTGYPKGGSCDGQVQITLLDRPNLVLPPGGNPQAIAVDSFSGFMVPSTTAGIIYAQSSTLIELGQNAPAYSLPNGATLGLTNGYSISISGPATINGRGSITLTNGGVLNDNDATPPNPEIPDGTTITIAGDGTVQYPDVPPGIKAFFPLQIEANGQLQPKANYMLPSSPDEEVRLPVVPPK